MKVYKESIEVDREDTIFDVDSKLFYLEMKHLNKILNDEFKFPEPESLKSTFKSQKAVPEDIDDKIFEDFERYKKNYSEILKKFNPKIK